MPIIVEKLGPGVLTLGAGPLAVQQQLTACKLVCSENVKTEDALPVLSGEETPETSSETFSWTLQGEVLQSLLAGDVVAFSWANKGVEVACHFEPNDNHGTSAEFDFTVKPVPLQVGGDEVKARMTASFTWRVVGDPTPTWAVA
jgi:hypothetical protein